jgi:hypothetical protein
MNMKKILLSAIMLFGFSFLAPAATPVLADDIIIGPRIDVYTGPRDQNGQTSAYDSVNNRFLAVWHGPNGAVDSNIYGQLVNPDGTLYGGTIGIATASKHQDGAKAAFDPVNKVFLVVWSDERNSRKIAGQPSQDVSAVYGQFVNPDGTLKGGNFAISNVPPSDQSSPGASHPHGIAYDSVLGRFFVLATQFEDMLTSVSNLYGRFVNPDGTMGGDFFPITNYTSAFGAADTVLLTLDNINNRFLITFRKFIVNTGTDTFTEIILNNNGTTYTPEFDMGLPVYSSVCFDEVNARFLLLRTADALNGIRGRLLNADGSFYGSEIGILQANQMNLESAAFDKALDKFFVVGLEAGKVFGQLVNQDGTLHETRFVISNSGKDPVINFGSAQSGSLIVWWDTPYSTGSDIFGKFVKTTNDVAPVIDPIGNKEVVEGGTLEFIVNATDANNDPLTYTAGNLPLGATFNPTTRIFRWIPTYDQADVYNNVHFEVNDGTLADSEDITITVTNVNRPPVLASIGNKSVNEGSNLQFTISATDPDGNALTYSASNLPSGVVFNPATRQFLWTPGYNQAGTYSNVRFQVSDGIINVFENITITVKNANAPPQFDPDTPSEFWMRRQQLVYLWAHATDPQGQQVYYYIKNAPSNSAFWNNFPLGCWYIGALLNSPSFSRWWGWEHPYNWGYPYNRYWKQMFYSGYIPPWLLPYYCLYVIPGRPWYYSGAPWYYSGAPSWCYPDWPWYYHPTQPCYVYWYYPPHYKPWRAGNFAWIPCQVGDFQITIVARNSSGQEAEKTIVIHVKK